MFVEHYPFLYVIFKNMQHLFQKNIELFILFSVDIHTVSRSGPNSGHTNTGNAVKRYPCIAG